jgi:hypothetical protein
MAVRRPDAANAEEDATWHPPQLWSTLRLVITLRADGEEGVSHHLGSLTSRGECIRAEGAVRVPTHYASLGETLYEQVEGLLRWYVRVRLPTHRVSVSRSIGDDLGDLSPCRRLVGAVRAVSIPAYVSP